MTDKKTITLDRGTKLLLRDAGINLKNVLRRAGFAADFFMQEQVRLSPAEYFRLWEAVEAEVDDPALPIRIAESASPEVFHPALFAALCSPNLAVAAKRMAQYKKLVAPIILDCEERPDALCITLRWDDPTLVPPAILDIAELVFLTQIARIGTRERICPVQVEVPFFTEHYEAYFGILPQKADRCCIAFSTEDAQRPFLTASESMWKTFEPELQRRISKLEMSSPLRERLRSVLLEMLPSGETSVHAAAQRLGVSVRTLQRSLKQQGTSYKDIVRQTRERLARHYVTNTTLAYGEISFLIGFEEPSSFFRAFREWTGKTPDSFRLAHA